MYRKVVGQWLGVAVLCWCLPTGSHGQDAPGLERSAAMREQLRLLKYFDTNRDRVVDVDEFSVGFEGAALMLMLSWDECDLNGDEAIDLEEFSLAVAEGRRALAQAREEEYEAEVTEVLASAVTLNVLLDRLALQVEYAVEIAELRQALKDFDDGDVVVTYVLRYPDRYPRLTPVIRTWGRYYPVKSSMRKHFGRPAHRPHWYVKPPSAKKRSGKVGVRPGPRPKPGGGPKPGGRPKPGGQPKQPPKPPPKPGP